MEASRVQELPHVRVLQMEERAETGWLTLDEAADWLHMTRRGVEKLLAKRELRAKKFGRSVRIRYSDLEQWARNQPDWRGP